MYSCAAKPAGFGAASSSWTSAAPPRSRICVRDSAQPTFSPSLVHVPGAWLAADQNEWTGALGSADTAHAPITTVKAKKRVIIDEHAMMLEIHDASGKSLLAISREKCEFRRPK